MNIAGSLFGLSQLEAMKAADYTVKVGDDIVTLKQLLDFWIEGHRLIEDLTDEVIKTEDKNGVKEKSNKGSKGQKKLQTEQHVEELQKKEIRRTRRQRLDNSQAAD